MNREELPAIPERGRHGSRNNMMRHRRGALHSAAAAMPPVVPIPPAAEDAAPPTVQAVPARAAEPKAAKQPVKTQSIPILGALGSMGPAAILPVVLAVNALGLGGKPGTKAMGKPKEPAPRAETAPEQKEEENVSAKQQPISLARRRAEKKMPEHIAESPTQQLAVAEPALEAEPAPAPRPVRRSAPPVDIRNLLNDISGYLPGNGSASAARVARIMGLADEIKSMGRPGVAAMSYAPSNPFDRQAGLLNVLSRNLPIPGAGNLSQISQVMTMVNTLRSTTGGGSGGLGNIGNIGSMAGMLGGMMNKPAAASPAPAVMSTQAEGIKDTVNRLLSGMDDKQKDQLMNRAKDFLGKK